MKVRHILNKHKELVAYLGYGNEHMVNLMGSVFYERKLRDTKLDDSKWRNARRMIRLFHSKPIANEVVHINFKGHSNKVITDAKGYFETVLNLKTSLEAGNHSVNYTFGKEISHKNTINGQCLVVDRTSPFGIISDIDDTIVTSHSSSFGKKVRTALFNNSRSRKPNMEIALFYQKLKNGNNPFFYVSNSELNMYCYWMDFLESNGFPIGPLLLKELKFGLRDFIFSRKGSHQHKYDKIRGILRFYPNMPFILVGDNGQQDLQIYNRIVMEFPKRIIGVFIVPVHDRDLDQQIVQNCMYRNVDVIRVDNWNQADLYAKSKGFF